MNTRTTIAARGAATRARKDEAGVDQFAVRTAAKNGAGYFNPLLGHSEEHTFRNISDVMLFLHEILDPKNGINIEDAQHGMRLILETVCVAAQYQANRLAAQEGGAA